MMRNWGEKQLEESDSLDTDGPDTDERVGVTGKEGLTISRPGQGNSLGRVGLLANVGELGLELINDGLGLQIPDLDAGRSGSAQPVTVGGEDQGVDDIITLTLERVQVLALVQIPEHGDTITSTGGAERTIGGDGDGVDVTGVTDVVGAKLALGELPDLDDLVPASGDDDGVGGVRGEADAGDPLGVTILLDGELALTEGVPELDGLVTGSGDDLTVIGRERNRENIVGVTDEATGGGTGVEVPETEGLVPGSGQGELTIGGDDDILDGRVVSVEGLLGDTEVTLVIVSQVPDNDGLVAGRRQDHVGGLSGGGDGGDPVTMTGELSAVVKRLSRHGC